MVKVKISSFQGVEGELTQGRIKRWSTEDFQSWENTLYAIMMNICLSFSKPIECTTLRVNHNVNYAPWVIMMPYRSLSVLTTVPL